MREAGVPPASGRGGNTLKKFQGRAPESQGHNLVLTFFHVPYSLGSDFSILFLLRYSKDISAMAMPVRTVSGRARLGREHKSFM